MGNRRMGGLISKTLARDMTHVRATLLVDFQAGDGTCRTSHDRCVTWNFAFEHLRCCNHPATSIHHQYHLNNRQDGPSPSKMLPV